jgi:hypothetical protein
MTQPRSLFKPEERDNAIYEMTEEQRIIRRMVEEIHTVLLGVPNSSDQGLCGRVHKNEERQRDFENNSMKEKVGLGIGVILALIAALI